MFIRFETIPASDEQTDGQTDRWSTDEQTVRQNFSIPKTAISITARCKNGRWFATPL